MIRYAYRASMLEAIPGTRYTQEHKYCLCAICMRLGHLVTRLFAIRTSIHINTGWPLAARMAIQGLGTSIRYRKSPLAFGEGPVRGRAVGIVSLTCTNKFTIH